MKRLSVAMLLSLAAVLVLSVMGWADTSASAGPATKALITLSLSSATLADGIDALFIGSGYSYAIDPQLKGRKVILSLNGVTFEEALKVLVKASDVTYTIEDGIYIFAPIKPKVDAAKSTNKITIHQAVKTAEEPATDQTDVAAQPGTQPEQPQQDQMPVFYQAVDAYGQQINMNPAYGQGFYQQPNMQIGNVTIMNGGYEPYTAPFTVGGGGYNNVYGQSYGQQYQSPMGWQPYNQFQTPYGMQPYYRFR